MSVWSARLPNRLHLVVQRLIPALLTLTPLPEIQSVVSAVKEAVRTCVHFPRIPGYTLGHVTEPLTLLLQLRDQDVKS